MRVPFNEHCVHHIQFAPLAIIQTHLHSANVLNWIFSEFAQGLLYYSFVRRKFGYSFFPLRMQYCGKKFTSVWKNYERKRWVWHFGKRMKKRFFSQKHCFWSNQIMFIALFFSIRVIGCNQSRRKRTQTFTLDRKKYASIKYLCNYRTVWGRK